MLNPAAFGFCGAELTAHIVLLLCFLFPIAALRAAPTVTKVEPPNWRAGGVLTPVRLLIQGYGLAGATVNASPGLLVDRVSVNANGTYLFVDVGFGKNPPAAGLYSIRVRTETGAATVPFRIDPPLNPAGRFAGFTPDDVIYLIMPDRFANGDPSNDDPAVSRGLFGRRQSRLYHGGDLRGIIDHLSYLKELGVTALWLTPVYDNSNQPSRDGNHPTSDYHGYGAVDFYAVEEHFGSLPLLRKLVDEAHRLGMKVIQDQVANHCGPSHPWIHDPPTATWFHGSALHHLTETFHVWNLLYPHASRELVAPVLQGWFADLLPDLNQDDPELRTYEIQNALW